MKRTISFLAAFLSVLAVSPAAQAQIARGRADQAVNLGGLSMDVFTYRPSPSRCSNPRLLVVIHGLNRNAKGYRNAARPLADRLCMLVVTPLFDRQRFPTARFQRGGIVEGNAVLPPNRWTGALIPRIVEWARQQERTPLEYSLIGHSAGGQFLSRLAAFVPTQARRIVIANPSTHVMPSLRVSVPYGLAGVYQGGAAQDALRRYLAAPVTIYLGEDDDEEDENLATSRAAMAQGANRHERGMNAFQSGKAAAAANKWPFNWRLIEAPGVGHSARAMFGADQAVEALQP